MERDNIISGRILDDMTDGVIAIDLSGTIITFNPAAARILGIAEQEALSKSFGEVFLLAEDNDDFNQTILDAIYESSTSHNRIVPFSHNDKRTILALTTTFLKAEDGSGQRMGVINSLLSGSSAAATLLAQTEFYIFPMHNVDGVIAGNYRSTPKSENLEVMWYLDAATPINLRADVPQEIAVIHQYAKRLMSDGGPPVAIALNLHASNSEPDIRTFFYPHFGTTAQGYTAPQAALWDTQIRFINLLAARYSADLLEPAPDNGGSGFANSPFPESWWWANFQDTVMAMTIEMTYGRSGFAPRWVTPDDTRQLGAALLWAIGDYCSGASPAKTARTAADSISGRQLLYPAWYPPNAADELKY